MSLKLRMVPQHLVECWLSISFFSFNLMIPMQGVYISILTNDFMNEFEIDKFHKKYIINTNIVSSLDPSWSNLSAYVCQSDFLSSKVNSFLLKNTPTQWESPSPKLSAPPALFFMNWLFKKLPCDYFAFLSCRAIQSSLSPCLIFLAKYKVKFSIKE